MYFFCYCLRQHSCAIFFFFNDTATTEIYTLSLHDALPICLARLGRSRLFHGCAEACLLARKSGCDDCTNQQHKVCPVNRRTVDRKSTRLNSSHQIISYAVFCLKKKKKQTYKL